MNHLERKDDANIDMGSILDLIDEPASIISPDYEVIAVNQAYQTHYGVNSAESLAGKYCFQISHGYQHSCDEAGESCPLKQCKQSGHKERLLHIHNTRNGHEYVDVEMRPLLDRSGQAQYYLEVMRTIKEANAQAQGDAGMVGRSPAFTRMLDLVHRAAPSEISVLLLGESGTGKELVAKAIHDSSQRSDGPFVTVECSGLSESLFESELFGHERGAFTGAVSKKTGLVEAARGGTLFLDEIGEIPLQLQVKLLRLIETGTFRVVGGVELKHADFRLVCATHRNLKEMVRKGRFRQDLFYRISPFPIPLPRLRERADDLTLLIRVLLKRLTGAAEPKARVTEKALGLLASYEFPGNIRELRNILERALLLSDDGVIDVDQLPPEVVGGAGIGDDDLFMGAVNDVQVVPLDQVESRYLRQVVARFGGDNRILAQQLGVSERTLYRKLRALKKV